MSRDITRRDILDGVALTVAASLLPGGAAAAPGQPVPPARTGLRGSHDGAFEVAHSLAFGERSFAIDGLPVEELHDLVVVGAGISGLAAAHYYRRRFGRQARVLVLDNHDDVGGHATRNEFKVGGRTLLSYGGSESLQSPTSFSATVNALMGELGVEIDRFETYFDRRLYADLGLQRATFFDAATFGTDRLVAGDPTVWVSDDTVPGRRPERPIRDFVADFPMSEEARAQLLAIHTEPRSILPDLAPPARERALKRVSYPDFLRTHWGAGEEALRFFAQRTHDYFGLPAAFVTAEEAWQADYPGSRASRTVRPTPGASPISITSRTATPPSRACSCAASCPGPCRARPWRTWSWRACATTASTSRTGRCASACPAPWCRPATGAGASTSAMSGRGACAASGRATS